MFQVCPSFKLVLIDGMDYARVDKNRLKKMKFLFPLTAYLNEKKKKKIRPQEEAPTLLIPNTLN